MNNMSYFSHDPITANRDRMFPFLKGALSGTTVSTPIPTLSKKAELNDPGLGTLGGAAMGGVAGGYGTRGLLNLLGAEDSTKMYGSLIGALAGAGIGGYLGNKYDKPVGTSVDPLSRPESVRGSMRDLFLYGGLGSAGAALGDLTAVATGESKNPAFRVLMSVLGAGAGAAGAYAINDDIYKKMDSWSKDINRGKSEKVPEDVLDTAISKLPSDQRNDPNIRNAMRYQLSMLNPHKKGDDTLWQQAWEWIKEHPGTTMAVGSPAAIVAAGALKDTGLRLWRTGQSIPGGALRGIMSLLGGLKNIGKIKIW